MKRLVWGIIVAAFGVLCLASAGANPQGPAGSVIFGLLCLAGGGVLIFFGAQYLSRKKSVTEFALQMLREDAKIDAGELARRVGVSEISVRSFVADSQRRRRLGRLARVRSLLSLGALSQGQKEESMGNMSRSVWGANRPGSPVIVSALAAFLTLGTGAAFGASVKLKSGDTLTGEILGRIVLTSGEDETETDGRKTVAYVIIAGSTVETIDEQGVSLVADTTVALVAHGYYGTTPPQTERSLRFAERFVDFEAEEAGIMTISLQIDAGFAVTQAQAQNPLTDSLIGELRTMTKEEHEKGDGPPVLIPALRVKTPEGVVSVSMEEISRPARTQ